MTRHTDVEDNEIMNLTRQIFGFLEERNPRPEIAYAALLQTILELIKAKQPTATIEEAAMQLNEYVKRQLKLTAN